MREHRHPPFLNVILCSQTSNSISAAQRTLLHADQGDQACDQAQDPNANKPRENVCQIDAKCVWRRCGYDRDVAPAFGRNAESRQQDGAPMIATMNAAVSPRKKFIAPMAAPTW